jgi:hypothetical protein
VYAACCDLAFFLSHPACFGIISSIAVKQTIDEKHRHRSSQGVFECGGRIVCWLDVMHRPTPLLGVRNRGAVVRESRGGKRE